MTRALESWYRGYFDREAGRDCNPPADMPPGIQDDYRDGWSKGGDATVKALDDDEDLKPAP